MADTSQRPGRLRRSESFLGIHFDFHADLNGGPVGRDLTREMIETVIDQVQPDYIQCDCKGHPGYSSYPTKVGNAVPGIVGDPLRLWREVTAERGVALYMHYSGVWDEQALKHHPEWAQVDEKGEASDHITSVFGAYVDQLLISQLQELCDVYEVDGVWVDGDCWATLRDYGEKVIAAFQEETGIEVVPRTKDDPYFFEFSEFCREGFRKYLRHYVDAIHRHDANFQITSNWAFSSFIPERVSVALDFLSGDNRLQNSVNDGRLEARCLALQGKPWDLMSWGFSGRFPQSPYSTKTALQLQQEAAVVISQGGGYQAYFTQKRDGSLRTWEMGIMGEVAKFCRARQEFCQYTETVPQVALLYATQTYYRESPHLFGHWPEGLRPLQGILQGLLEAQYAVDILMEHHLSERLAAYPLLVVPEWGFLAEEVRTELLRYVEQGGRMLVIGARAAALFQEELGVELVGENKEKETIWLEHNGMLAALETRVQQVRLRDGTKEVGKRYHDNDFTGGNETVASLRGYGRGQIGAIYCDMGEGFVKSATTVAHDFLDEVVRTLFPRPMVEVKGSRSVEVSVRRKGEQLLVHLVNTAGPHANRDIFVFDEIPVVGPLTVTIRCERRPERVRIEPLGLDVEYEWENGALTFVVEKLELHEIIVVE